MSILDKGKAASGAKTQAGNPWAERVRVVKLAEPWWPTNSIQAVAEVQVAGLLSCLVHVARSAKSGRLFVAMPSTRREGDWLPTLSFIDAALREAVEAAAILAYEKSTRLQPVDAGEAASF